MHSAATEDLESILGVHLLGEDASTALCTPPRRRGRISPPRASGRCGLHLGFLRLAFLALSVRVPESRECRWQYIPQPYACRSRYPKGWVDLRVITLLRVRQLLCCTPWVSTRQRCEARHLLP